MTPHEVFRFFGSQKKTAAALGVTKGAMSHWKKSGVVPALRQAQIQLKTKGRLRADPDAIAAQS